MAEKGRYHTRQQSELLTYLEATRGKHLTASQIRTHFSENGVNMGLATVYRQMDRLVQEGTVRKYILDSGGSACYEYVGNTPAEEHYTHFHCKCERCGRLIHMDCEELEAIQAHLLEHHGFMWNAGKTVFYGVCEQCRAAED